jgi:hypothetical protein
MDNQERYFRTKGGTLYPMAIKMPEGEILRKAIQWISAQRESVPGRPLIQLIDEAGKNFDLSPKDGEFLLHFFMENKEPAA